VIDVRILTSSDVVLLTGSCAADVFDNDVDPKWAAAFLADSRHHIAAAIVDGTVIGFASAVHYLHPDKPPELWINEVGVAAAYQGRGVGARLLQALFGVGRDLGCRQAWVLTERDNGAAMRLYAGAGGAADPGDTVMFEFDL
jgi:aminoglycoside 6'-N-acetyltransferase I